MNKYLDFENAKSDLWKLESSWFAFELRGQVSGEDGLWKQILDERAAAKAKAEEDEDDDKVRREIWVRRQDIKWVYSGGLGENDFHSIREVCFWGQILKCAR